MELSLCLTKLINSYTNDLYRILIHRTPLKRVIIVIQGGYNTGKTVLMSSLIWKDHVNMTLPMANAALKNSNIYRPVFTNEKIMYENIYINALARDGPDLKDFVKRASMQSTTSYVICVEGYIPPEAHYFIDYLFTAVGDYKFKITGKNNTIIEDFYKVNF